MNAKLTQDELQAIKERAEKATSGPWYHTERDTQDIERYICSDSTGDFVVSSGHYYDEDWSEIKYDDAEFIANAREDIPQLVAEVERLQRKLRYLCNKDIPHMIRSNGEEFYYEWVEKFEKEGV